MYQNITLFVIAAVLLAAADARVRRSAYGGQNMNVQSSSAFSGGPGSGSASSGGASASASSYAGSSSYSGGGGSYSGSSGGGPGSYQGGSNAGNPSGSYGLGGSTGGSSSGSYGQGPSNLGSSTGSYGPSNGDRGSSDNAIPSGNPYTYGGGGYASGFPNSYGGGFQDSGFTPGQNLPPGCFSGFQGGAGGLDPLRIHQEIMNNIQRQHEENLRFGANLASQAGQGGTGPGPHTVTYVYHTGNAHPWAGINVASFNQQLANFFRYFPWPVPAVPFSFPTVVPINRYSKPQNQQRYTSYQSAFASGHIGPGGGYGAAGVSPKDPGSLATRFGDPVPSGPVHSVSGNIPPPSGGAYGISTSSHSHTDVVDGVPKTYKESSVTVNDNGKVTSYKSHSP